MVAQAPEARLLEERQRIINLIPGREVIISGDNPDCHYFLKRKGIKKDLIIAGIGERGGGKSGTCSVISLVDFAFDGIPIYSNMRIAMEIEINDSIAYKYGLRRGGIARYQSIPIDMPKLLRFDEMYRGSLIFLDEINIEIAEARRAMSNTNLFSNRLAQEVRHLESSIIFTCISEMAVDPRWRDIVDCFIKCEETAYYEENIIADKPLGTDFGLSFYFMNKCFNGHTYAETKKAERNIIFHFKPWHGIYNDKEFQGAGMKKYGIDMRQADGQDIPVGELTISDAPNVAKYYKNWDWIVPIAEGLLNSDEKYIPSLEVWEHPEVAKRLAKREITKNEVSSHLKDHYNIFSKGKSRNGIKISHYWIPNKDEIVQAELESPYSSSAAQEDI